MLHFIDYRLKVHKRVYVYTYVCICIYISLNKPSGNVKIKTSLVELVKVNCFSDIKTNFLRPFLLKALKV